MSQRLYRVHKSPLINAAMFPQPFLWLAHRGAVLGQHGSSRRGCTGGEAEDSSVGHFSTPLLGKQNKRLAFSTACTAASAVDSQHDR
jgi:hypothetical protein